MQGFLDAMARINGTYEDLELKRQQIAENDRTVADRRAISEILANADGRYTIAPRQAVAYDRAGDPEADIEGPPSWLQQGGEMPTRAVEIPGGVDRARQYRDMAVPLSRMNPALAAQLTERGDNEPFTQFTRNYQTMQLALANGDDAGAARAAQAAYNQYPDGYVASIEPLGGGKFRVVRVDEKTGKVEGVQVLTADQLKDEGARIANPSAFYGANLQADLTREGHKIPNYGLHNTPDGTVYKMDAKTGQQTVVGRHPRPDNDGDGSGGGKEKVENLARDVNSEIYRFNGVQPGMLDQMTADQQASVGYAQRHAPVITEHTAAAHGGRWVNPAPIAHAAQSFGTIQRNIESMATPPPQGASRRDTTAYQSAQQTARNRVVTEANKFSWRDDGQIDVREMNGVPVVRYNGSIIAVTPMQLRLLNQARQANRGGTQN